VGEVNTSEKLRLHVTLNTSSSIYIKIDTCNELCIRACKKNCCGSDIVDLTNASHWDIGDEILSIGWSIRNASEVREESGAGY
jgi:hypothetical protein